jgi:glycosyltransferase involved in cell wall biosynthesis
MKILILQDYLRSGGTERQSVLLANAFAAEGHPTTLMTFRPGGALAGTVHTSVTHRVLQPFDTHLDWFAPGLYRQVEMQAPDIVLCMGRMANCYGQALQSLLQDRWPRTAVIATMRTGKKLPWLFRRSLPRVRHIIANSNEARQTLVNEHRLVPEKISVIYNSLVFPSELSDTAAAVHREAVRTQHGATSNTTVFLCVAMFRPEKNQRELIEIVSALPVDADWQLWLAGDGPARPACERLVIEKNLTGRVKFLGFQPDPSPLYDAADLAVHASWSEALSNFLIEAQARGVPAVAYNAQGIAECFLPDETGFVIARDDRDAFRRQLMQLMNETATVRAAREARARDHARTTFDPQRQVAAYLKLFQSFAPL